MPLQNHHIIPQELFPGGGRRHEIFDIVSTADFPKDSEAINIAGLPDTWDGMFGDDVIQGHRGSHPGYTDWIIMQLDGIVADVDGDPVAARNQMIGLTNELKFRFSDPDFRVPLNGGSTEDIFDLWDRAITRADLEASEFFKAGALYGSAVAMAQNGDFSAKHVDRDSPFNSFRYDVVDREEQSRKLADLEDQFRFVRDNLPPDFDPGERLHRETAGVALQQITLGVPREDVAAVLSGAKTSTSVKTPDGFSITLMSPASVTAVAAVLHGLDQGSAIVDGISLLLLGYGLKEADIVPEDTDFAEMISIVAGSNVASAIVGNIDQIALGVGKELVLSGAATMLGVGLLWKGYEIYQSLDGLESALAFAADQSDGVGDDAILALNEIVQDVRDWLTPARRDPDYVPAHAEIARFYVETLGEDAIEPLTEAVRSYLRVVDPDAASLFGPGDIEGALYRLSLFAAENSGLSLVEALQNAIVTDAEMLKAFPGLLAAIDADNCFAAGTPIRMHDGSEKAIEHVAVGDCVLSFDAAGRAVAGEVTRLFRKSTSEWIELGSEGLLTTEGHRFLTPTGEYRAIGTSLALGGDRVQVVRCDGTVVQLEGRRRAVIGARMAAGAEEAAPGDVTYNFEVAVHHNYVAGGLRVHNDSILGFLTTAEKARIVNVELDATGRPSFAVAQESGSNTEFEYKLRNGSEAVVEATYSDGAGNLYYSRIVRNKDGEIVERGEPQLLTGQGGGAALMGTLTPFLTTALVGPDGSVFEKVAADTVLGTVLDNLGEVVGGTIHRSLVDFGRMDLDVQVQTAIDVSFEDFGGELVINGSEAVISVVNQLILAEIYEATEIDGVPGAVLDAALGAGINEVLGRGFEWFFDLGGTEAALAQAGFSPESIAALQAHEFGGLPGASVDSPFGTKAGWTGLIVTAIINEILPDIETIQGQIASAVASTAFSIFTSLGWQGGPVGAVVGFVVGKLFDAIFDEDPRAFTHVGFDEATGRFVILDTWSKDGGNRELSQELAQLYVDGMNGFIDAVKSQSHNFDELGQWSFGHFEDALKNAGRRGETFDDFQSAYIDAYVRDLAEVQLNDGQMGAVQAVELVEVGRLRAEREAHSQWKPLLDAVAAMEEPGAGSIRMVQADGLNGAEFQNSRHSYWNRDFEGHATHGATYSWTADQTFVQRWDGFVRDLFEHVFMRLQPFHRYYDEGSFHHTMHSSLLSAVSEVMAPFVTLNDRPSRYDSEDGWVYQSWDRFLYDSTYRSDGDGGQERTSHVFTTERVIASITPVDGLEDVMVLLGLPTTEFLTEAQIYEAVSSRLQIAQDYHKYLENEEAVTAMVQLNPDSALAAGWVATLAAAREMGLDVAYDLTGDAPDSRLVDRYDNTFYTANQDDVVRGLQGDDFVRSYGGADTLIGGDGNDTLEAGDGADSVLGGAGHDRLRGGNEADTLRGGSGNDVLRGDGGDDALLGDNGDDVLIGGAGRDTLSGGAGRDRAQYSEAATGVLVDLQDLSRNTGEAADDVFKSIEDLHGSDRDDNLRGDAKANVIWGSGGRDKLYGRDGNDHLLGGSGNDTLWGGAGADKLDGGSGTDWVQYDVSGDLTVDLKYASVNTGEADGDTFTGVENLRTGTGDDRLHGTDGRNFLWGRGGDDSLHGRGGDDTLAGDAGNDTVLGGSGDDDLRGGDGDDILQGHAGRDRIDGGRGTDRAQYSDAAGAVRADLSGAVSGLGDASGDTFHAVENLHGSRYGDTLYGDAGANVIWGWHGDDTVHGRDGADDLRGGGGRDSLDGGTGNDRLRGEDGDDVLIGGTGRDTLDGGAGFDRAQYSTASSGLRADLGDASANTGDAAGDVFSGIEGLHGSRHDDDLRGDTRANTLWGWQGHDKLFGRDGNDRLFGGEGNDTLWGGAGFDTLDGGSGTDRAHYSVSTGLTVDLKDASRNTGEAAGDSFVSIENLHGGTGGDRLFGTEGGNSIWGSDGTDLIYGRGGNDRLYGGSGNDGIFGNSGNDLLKGDSGNDTLQGNSGADTLDGGTGTDRATYNDAGASVTADLSGAVAGKGHAAGDRFVSIEHLHGSRHADRLIGSDGSNTVWGWIGSDRIEGKAGSDSLLGGDGDDTIYADAQGSNGYSQDTLRGEGGHDVLYGSNGSQFLSGGDGNDTLRGGDDSSTSDTDTLDGGDGHDHLISGMYRTPSSASSAGDRLYGRAGADRLEGGTARDTLEGGSGHDHLSGGAGNDTLYGSGSGENNYGHDTLFGEEGDDVLHGSNGRDLIHGGTGDDTITGGYDGTTADRDRLFGEDGDDSIASGQAEASSATRASGGDLIDGGAGNDTLIGGGADDSIVGGSGSDIMRGGSGADTLWASSEDSTHMSSDTLYGDTGNDVLWGTNGGQKLYGGSGNDTLDGGTDARTSDRDTLEGGSGDDMILSGFVSAKSGSSTSAGDVLRGGDGDDTLVSGRANDVLEGGRNVDTFVFDKAFGHDTVLDFAAGNGEKIVIRRETHWDGDITSWNDMLRNHLTEVDGNAVITRYSSSSITLVGVSEWDIRHGSDYTEHDFVFMTL